MPIPHLRLRSEYSFRKAYGPVKVLAETLATAGAEFGAIVDPGTWGHVEWQAAAKKNGFRAGYGMEFEVLRNERKPVAWALAAGDARGFYRMTSEILCSEYAPERIEAALIAAKGAAVRFSGAAITNPEAFDYVDMNPASLLQQRHAFNLARSTGKPLVLTSDNAYPSAAHRGRFMVIVGRAKMTPQHVITDSAEFRTQFRCLSDAEYRRALANTHEAAERTAAALPIAPQIHFDGDFLALVRKGKAARIAAGRIKKWTKVYEERVKKELELIALKKFESYFLVVADLIAWAKERMLVGPGRGSSAGSLVCFLIGITEVDPIPHGLLFERFIDITRADLPDIDIDFNDQKREQIFPYLSEKYGASCVARIGNINSLQPRSVINECVKRLGIPREATYDLADSIQVHASASSLYGHGLDQAMQSAAGVRFLEKYPEARIMGEVEGHAWHAGVHAAGVIVSNVPVNEFATVGADGVAQITKYDAEALNLLKIDALGLRTLGVIESTGCVTNEQLYGLNLEDQRVLDVINARRYCGIFQFEGPAQRNVARYIPINSFMELDHITALARPGPLGGGASDKYIRRHAGEEPVETRHPMMDAVLGETYGVALYQEQVMRIVREVGLFTWEQATEVRKGMSKSKGKEFFDGMRSIFLNGAAKNGIDETTADAIWYDVGQFGAWGMNKSHTCAYAMISYWCAYMKYHHPLEFAAACLRGEKDDAATAMLRELDSEGVRFVPFDPLRSLEDWAVIDGELIGGFQNLAGFGPAKASAAIEQRAAGGWNKKMRTAIEAAAVSFANLYPLRTAYGDIYRNPENYGCETGSKVLEIGDFPEAGNVLFICTIIDKKPRDMNEVALVAKRISKGQKGHYTSPTAFAQFRALDDSGVPVILRVDRFDYERIGKKMLDVIVPGEDVVMVRGMKLKGWPMVKVDKVRCLSRAGAL